jgi:perosamine synthetase
MKYRINQVKPFIDSKELRFIKNPITNSFITEGPQSKLFLNKLLKITKSKYGVLAPNGTLAITVAIMALGLKRGDEIIIPNFTFYGSYSAAILAGLKPILCDVDKENFQIDLASAKKIITPKTKAIMPVHIYGGSVNMSSVLKFSRKNKLKVVEDAAQALGVKYKGKSAGSFGHVSAFSFYADKALTTGEGGLIVTNNKKIYKNLLLIRNQGRIKSGSFIHNNLGYNFRFNDILASVGLAQLKKFDLIKKKKLEIYNKFKNNLQDLKEVKFFEPIKNSNFIPFRVPIIVTNLKKLMIFLENNKIQTRGFFFPLHSQKGVNKRFIQNKKDKIFFKNSIYGNKNGLALPCYPSLKESDILFICKKIKQFYAK